jgi:hypothetical protein
VESRRFGPAELAAARIDVADWLARLPRFKRRVAATLGSGESTGATAKRHGVTAGRSLSFAANSNGLGISSRENSAQHELQDGRFERLAIQRRRRWVRGVSFSPWATPPIPVFGGSAVILLAIFLPECHCPERNEPLPWCGNRPPRVDVSKAQRFARCRDA